VADLDIPADLIGLKQQFLEADARWARAARRDDPEAADAAYRDAQRLALELDRHPWLVAHPDRNTARMALLAAAKASHG
jgi:hypothetical protein